MSVEIAPATQADKPDWLAMRCALWPDESKAGMRDELDAMLESTSTTNFIAREAGHAVGFAEAAIRHDYVNGCETSPVLFLEGIYVQPTHRRRGIARALVEAVAEWGRARGCTEFASDALIDNESSHRMHAALGFEETERVVYFRRRI